MGDTERFKKQDYRYIRIKPMTSVNIAPPKLEFSIDLEKMELQMKGSNIRIKYYEGLGWAPVISEEQRRKG